MASPSCFSAYKVQSFSVHTVFYRMIHVYLTIQVIVCCFIPAVSPTECKKTDVCTCDSKTMTVDLSPLKTVKGGRYVAKSNPEHSKVPNTYLYNPCLPFSNSSQKFPRTTCSNTLLCQESGGDFYALGVPAQVEFTGSPEDQNLAIKYTNGDRTSIMAIICSYRSNPEFKLIEEDKPPKQYRLELHTRYACLPGPSSISTGSVLVILFFVFLVVYIVGGVLFLRFARGAQGAEMLPNREFWNDFPLLVRDGVYFVCRGCKADTTYEQI